MNKFFSLLNGMKEHEASDLYFKVGRNPIYRINKDLFEVSDWEQPLTKEEVSQFAQSIMLSSQYEIFKKEKEFDFAYENSEIGRFRVNVFMQRGNPGIVLRRIKNIIPTIEELHLPKALEKIALFTDGMILVTGPTRSGKSTTLTSMIEFINQNEVRHIITVEDPIEYVYQDKKSVIDQREIGLDTFSFTNALKYVLRQDPDVILIGELRDANTFEAAINASETGHLVFGTLHTNDTLTTVTRVLEFFPGAKHDQVRTVLAHHLKAAICQKLVPTKDGEGLVPVCEILIVTPIISKLIQENRLNKVYSAMASDKEMGMHTFNQHLVELIQNGTIEKEVGFTVSPSPRTLEMNLRGIYLDEDTKIIGE